MLVPEIPRNEFGRKLNATRQLLKLLTQSPLAVDVASLNITYPFGVQQSGRGPYGLTMVHDGLHTTGSVYEEDENQFILAGMERDPYIPLPDTRYQTLSQIFERIAGEQISGVQEVSISTFGENARAIIQRDLGIGLVTAAVTMTMSE